MTIQQTNAASQLDSTWTETCHKCGGSGRWNAPTSLGHQWCTACGGRGAVSYKSSPEARAKARVQRQASEARRAARLGDERQASFEEAHPNLAAWWKGSTFEFAIAMREAVRKYGSLTDRQLAASNNAAEKLQAIRARLAAAAAVPAPTLDIGAIEAVFSKALASGLRRPLLRIGDFRLSPAKADGKNAGAIYIKAGERYLGKIMDAKFTRAHQCSMAEQEQILKLAADPKAAAIEHGKLSGCCAICGRALTDEKSVEQGIGPVCAKKFGW